MRAILSLFVLSTISVAHADVIKYGGYSKDRWAVGAGLDAMTDNVWSFATIAAKQAESYRLDKVNIRIGCYEDGTVYASIGADDVMSYDIDYPFSVRIDKGEVIKFTNTTVVGEFSERVRVTGDKALQLMSMFEGAQSLIAISHEYGPTHTYSVSGSTRAIQAVRTNCGISAATPASTDVSNSSAANPSTHLENHSSSMPHQ